MGDKEDKRTIEDLADWFLAKEPMTQKKLQKLCYYAVAWGYALMDRHIVENDEFQAWVHGPVSPTLFTKYHDRGWTEITSNKPAPKFPKVVEELLESVWSTYGSKDGTELEALSHTEQPWREARAGLSPTDRSTNTISKDTMRTFYRTIYAGGD